MHWFWRVPIALWAGIATWVFLRDCWVRLFSGESPIDDWADAAVGQAYSDHVLGATLPVVVFLAVYWLLRFCPNPKMPFDPETRCRKCSHILKGITEPRCPECGERI